MTTIITKKSIAAALTLSTLTGGMVATTTATFVTTAAAVSVLSAIPAQAASCNRFVSSVGFSKSTSRVAAERRAKRRAIRSWKRKAKSACGPGFHDFDDAIRKSILCDRTVAERGHSSGTRCIVSAFPRN